jgi:hypothetical protein
LRLQNPNDKKFLEQIVASLPKKNVISLKNTPVKQYKHETRGVRGRSNINLKNEVSDPFQIDSGKNIIKNDSKSIDKIKHLNKFGQ